MDGEIPVPTTAADWVGWVAEAGPAVAGAATGERAAGEGQPEADQWVVGADDGAREDADLFEIHRQQHAGELAEAHAQAEAEAQALAAMQLLVMQQEMRNYQLLAGMNHEIVTEETNAPVVDPDDPYYPVG